MQSCSVDSQDSLLNEYKRSETTTFVPLALIVLSWKKLYMLLVYLDLLAQLVFVFNCVLTCLFGGTESCHTYGMCCQGCQKHKVEDKIGEENEAANTSPLFIDEACHQWVLQEIGAIRFRLKMCRV